MIVTGFGFVNYDNHEHAAAAVDALNDKPYKSKILYVGRAQKKSEREAELRAQFEQLRLEKMNSGVNLYVKNLDEIIDDEMLRKEFEPFGTITSCKVMKDEKGVSKGAFFKQVLVYIVNHVGFGFVCFSSPDEATKAVTEMNTKILGAKPIYVALAQRKEVRRQLLASQMQQRANMRMAQPAMPGPYPGAPMFYPPVPQGARPMFFNQNMRPPRFPYPPQQFGQMPVGQVPPPNAVPGPMPAGMRPPRPVRPQGAPSGPMAHQGGARPMSAKRGGFKYTANARNAPVQEPTTSKLNAATLASLPPEIQKRTLGEALFPLVNNITPAYAGKITGMLLDMDNAELLYLLEDDEGLKAKVDEAVEAYEEFMKEQGGDQSVEASV